MYITPYMLGYANWYTQTTTKEILFFIPFMQVFLIGPVVYFYTRSLLNKSFTLGKKDYYHFIPFLLYSVYSFVVFITDKWIMDEYYFYANDRDKDLDLWYQVSGLLSMILYLALSLRYYARYKRLVYENVSYADSILFIWVRNFMLAFLAILFLRVIFFFTNPEWGEFGSQFWYFISFSFVFYYISINGYTQAIKSTSLEVQNNNSIDIFPLENTQPEKVIKPITKDIDEWKEKLLKLIISGQLYKNPTLTLSEVAEKLNTHQKVISSVVNSGFNMNFNDFINKYRVEAVITQLKEGEHKHKTLLGIAFECGFNSKATFNRSFKKNTSFSPKEFLNQLH